jgi:hypothetical protein
LFPMPFLSPQAETSTIPKGKSMHLTASAPAANKTYFVRLGIVFSALVLVSCFSPRASADIITYDIIFTTTEGPAPAAGSFTYNSTTPGFTNFTVTYNGVIFDLTDDANHPNNHASVGNCVPEDANTGWLIMSHRCSVSSSTDYWSVSPCCIVNSSFSFLNSNNVFGASVGTTVVGPQPGAMIEDAASQGSWSLSPPPPGPSAIAPEPGGLVLVGPILVAVAVVARKRVARRRQREPLAV